MADRVDAACQGDVDGAGDVGVGRGLEPDEWLDMVEQSPDQLPRRSSSEEQQPIERQRNSGGGIRKRSKDPLRRIRRILDPTDVPSMREFFRQVAEKTQSKMVASKTWILLYLFLVLMPSIMELGPRIDYPDYWVQTAIFCFIKRRRLQLTFTGNLVRILIRCCLMAIIPLIGMMSMEHPDTLVQLRIPNADFEMPVNLNIYAITLLPYILRLLAGFCLFVADTWVAYSDQVLTIGDTFNTWRLLVYLNQVMQLVYAYELLLLFIQGCMGFIHAYRVYKAFAGWDRYRVPSFDELILKDTFWFRPSRHSIAAYKAFRERALEYTPRDNRDD